MANPPEEFDIAGATYYAVAPAGYSYSSEQDTHYSTRKYNTLSAAEAALPTSPSTPMVINIIGDWTGITDSTQVTIFGTATSASNYLLIRTIGEARHNGIYDTSSTFYRLAVASRCMRVLENYVTVDGLLMEKISASANGQSPLELNPGAGAAIVSASNCIVLGFGSASFSEIGIIPDTEPDQEVYIWNCIIYNISSKLGSACIRATGDLDYPVYVYSCTAIGGNRGIERASGTLIVKNCYASGATAYIGTMTLTTCASSDTTGSAGLQNIAHDTDTFVNVTSGSEDYNLADGSPLTNVGVNTSDESEPLNFTTDIKGFIR